MTDTLRLGTRASNLATTQAGTVADAITELTGRAVELVPIVTEGDTSRAPLREAGGTGVFVSALRQVLLDGGIDLAVHSLKDIPTTPEPGITLAAVPVREDPRDALVARDGLTLADLPQGARVGTGSPRRAAQLESLRPDLSIRELRGNVETRIGKVTSGELDAVVLAAAGLSRLGLLEEATELLPTETMVSAPGQGALAVEVRTGDVLEAELAVLHHADTAAAVTAERALLAELEAGCSAPVGALGSVAGDELILHALAMTTDGPVRGAASGPVAEAADIGRRLARELLGAGELQVGGYAARSK